MLDLAAKGTIRNKEVFNRNYFEKLPDVDLDKFLQLIDVWVVEYAEHLRGEDHADGPRPAGQTITLSSS